MSDIIRIACWRANHDYTPTSAEYAALCVAPAAWQPCSLVAFFQEIIAAGAVVAELAQIYMYGQLVADVRAALEEGRADELQALAALLPHLLTLSAPTQAAIATTLAAHTLRLVDVVAAERQEEAPATVTAADVDEALGR